MISPQQQELSGSYNASRSRFAHGRAKLKSALIDRAKNINLGAICLELKILLSF